MIEFWRKINFPSLASIRANKGLLALDIGSTSIKMVETVMDKSGYRVLSLGMLPIPTNAIQNNMVADAKTVADTIRQLVKENKVRTTQVVSSIPGRAVIMKKIQMPMQEESELEANIEFEANSVIPERMENVNLDYQVLDLVDGGSKLDVLLVAVKKEIVNSYVEAIKDAGLVPVVMDVDYFALENMYQANYTDDPPGGVIGLIHVGARYTSITLIQNGVFTFTGDLPIGGDEFTDRVRRELKLSLEAAETYKTTGLLAGGAGGNLGAILQTASEDFSAEIHRTVSLYGTVGAEESDGVKGIYLSGGGAKVPGVQASLEAHMAVPVHMAEPFRGFTIAKSVDRALILESAPVFAIAAGLSIRRPGDK